MVYFLKDYVFAAKYPFTKLAKTIMEERGFVIDEEVLKKGVERLKEDLEAPKIHEFLHEKDALDQILSYAGARVILSYLRNPYLTNRFAVAESKRIRRYLVEEGWDVVEKIAEEIGMETMKRIDEKVSVDVAEYVRFKPEETHYKLIFRNLKEGRVFLNEHEAKRLIEEGVKKYLMRISSPQGLPDIVKRYAEEVKTFSSKLIKFNPKVKVSASDFPPCIKAIIESVKKHENVGHSGRWLLAVYLFNIGVSDEEIMGIFSNLPDFNEKITRYQIEHIKKRRYMVPNCSSVSVYGYCVANCGIKNPLNYGRKSNERKKLDKK